MPSFSVLFSVFLEKYQINRFNLYAILSVFRLHGFPWEFKNSVETNSLSLIESEFIKILIIGILSYYIIFLICLLACSFTCKGAGGKVCSFV